MLARGYGIDLTPDNRPRQLRDEAMTCGTQPANIRAIHRRFNDPVPTNALEDMKQDTSFYLKEGGQLFSLDNCQSYRERIPLILLRG